MKANKEKKKKNKQKGTRGKEKEHESKQKKYTGWETSSINLTQTEYASLTLKLPI